MLRFFPKIFLSFQLITVLVLNLDFGAFLDMAEKFELFLICCGKLFKTKVGTQQVGKYILKTRRLRLYTYHSVSDRRCEFKEMLKLCFVA